MKTHIDTKEGRYVGTVEASGVISFKGIPFAQPPLGDLRWLPPQPVATFDTERHADLYPPAPVQLNYPKHLADQMGEPIHIPISEDCLYLNVWSADLETPKKGILFWVFGGSYAIGHASRIQARGENFVAAHPEIVVVAANYRLGVFGSVDLSVLGGGNEYSLSNNLNLLDQRAALKWVRENAQEFAAEGCPITLFGHSAGSNAICHHLVSEDSLPLFERAICQSSFLEGPPPRTLSEARDASRRLFDAAGVSTVEQALFISSDKLLAAQHEVFGEIYGSPVIDGLAIKPGELERLGSGVAADKEVMIGFSNGERDSGFVGLSDDECIDRILRTNGKLLAGNEGIVDEYCSIHPELSTQVACMSLQAELVMTVPAEIQARLTAKHSKVYQYVFSWADETTGVRAYHGAPCPFVFGNQIPACAPADLSKKIQDAWASFIANGDPNCDSVPTWAPYSENGGSVMDISAEWKLCEGYWNEDYALLSHLFPSAALLGKEL